MLQPVPVDSFGGLNLPDDPQEIGWQGAIDIANLVFDRAGRLECRTGYSVVNDVAGTNPYDSLHVRLDGTVLAGAGTRIEALVAGAVTANTTLGASPKSFADVGSSNLTYIADGSGTIKKWNGSAFSSPAGLVAQDGKFLAVQAPDNRLVAAEGDRVWFSNPGIPETFTSTDWVDFSPGDGESITAVVAWSDKLFVFKPSRYAVFYGNTQDGTGGSIFNYQTVANGVGCSEDTLACATPEGVVFVHDSGLYLTVGGAPVYMSSPLEPLFRDVVPQYWSGTTIIRPSGLAYFERRLYLSEHRMDAPGGPTPATDRIFVFDIDRKTWTAWAITASRFAVARFTNELYFIRPTEPPNTNDICVFDGSEDDDGTTIGWYYQSGFADFGNPEVKRMRQWSVWAASEASSVTVKVAVDQGAVDTGGAVAVGTSPTVVEGWDRKARRGVFFSFRLSGTGPASVSRFVGYVGEARSVGARS